MHDRPSLVHEQRVLAPSVRLDRLSLFGVLVDRVAYRLRELGLDLTGGDGYAVDEQREVERFAPSSLVVNLMHEAEDVGVVALAGAGDTLVVGVARHALDRLVAGHGQPSAQREDGAHGLKAPHQRAPEMRAPALALLTAHLIELFRRRPLQELDEVVEDERVCGVEAAVVRRDLPA